MRHIPIIILLSFLFVGSIFGQDSACPTVSVDGPPDLPTKDKPEKFVVNISGKVMGKPLFAWTISTGAIIKGHGTSEILVSRDNYEGPLTATVEVSDLGPNCPVVYASATSEIATDPEFELFDEYDRLSWKNEQKRLSLAFAKLAEQNTRLLR